LRFWWLVREMMVVFRKITDEELNADVVKCPYPVSFDASEENWGSLTHISERHVPSGLYRLRATGIRVRNDLTNEQKIAVLAHEMAHALDLIQPSTLEHIQDLARTEMVAYQECLRSLLNRGLYLPLLWEMFAIEWDAEGQGECIYSRSAAQACYGSQLWNECRNTLLEAMNNAMPRVLPASVSWEGHEDVKLIGTGGPPLVVALKDGRIVDFQIVKNWSPNSRGEAS
jgi:hypothetical protein